MLQINYAPHVIIFVLLFCLFSSLVPQGYQFCSRSSLCTTTVAAQISTWQNVTVGIYVSTQNIIYLAWHQLLRAFTCGVEGQYIQVSIVLYIGPSSPSAKCHKVQERTPKTNFLNRQVKCFQLEVTILDSNLFLMESGQDSLKHN